ncbi:MAG: serine/threonine protein kinase, partial [Candidatus Saccharimonas sp.]|nr:serine/threonine protein kinase [Planctomycetaceae bacterium]
MANPADGGDDPEDILEGTSKPSTVDHATDPTYAYTPDNGAEAEDELVLSGSALLSSDIPIPARLGKYEIQGQIGRGGMGIVWKGFDPDLRRTVAIKVLSPHLAQSPVARRRFQREARAAAAINHENVLTIHSVEEQGETPFLVMEYVAGQSLKEYITERGKLGAIEVIRLSAQISQGLAAAHVQGVIHRDVKPANVMLHEGATRVRLMDFGLARVAFDNADLTSHDHAVGTPAYMAPEQIRGHDIDARADLFSLGCVMYCMVAGQSPFHGRNHAETIHKILDLVPARLHDVDPSVPLVLSEMVEKLLKKDPNERYQSAFEVAETLCRLLAQL